MSWKWLRNKFRIHRGRLEILAVFGVFIFLLELGTQEEPIEQFLRGEPGEEPVEEELEVEIPELGEEQILYYEVESRELTASEEISLLEAAQSEAMEQFCQGQDRLEHITGNVTMKEGYQNGLVEASWETSREELLSAEGVLNEDNLVDQELCQQGIGITVTVILSIKERQKEYSFPIVLYPHEQDEGEELLWKIRREIRRRDTENSSTDHIVLPTEVDGHKIQYRGVKEQTTVGFILLAIVVMVGMELVKKEREKTRWEMRKRQLLYDYPEFVSKVSLLLGAGMTMDRVMARLGENYKRQRQSGQIATHEVYELVVRASRELEDGVGELKVYEQFGNRCGLKEYRRFCAMITQNLRKGTLGLNDMLEKESANAFGQRRNLARQYGEEAGTKLLFPMILMLGIVMAILMVPAFWSFQM